MTNKIYLSFNRLYLLKDGDYHGAKLSYRIKHGDQVIAEGERAGKSLSRFITPVDIEEMEITKPLTVEYVCTGNVEEVSAFPAMPDEVFLTCQTGQVFINAALIYSSIITNAHLKLANDASLIGGNFPKIGDLLPDAAQREKVKEIVERYLSGACLEYADDMVDELMLIFAPDVDKKTLADCKKRFAGSEPVPFGGLPAAMSIAVETDSELSKEDQLKKLVNETVADRIKKELQPGGLLHRK